MFYSVQILSKGGPLQVIWLAAHMDRQLKRQQVFDTSIPFTVDAIIKPQGGASDSEAPLALRLTGQLLLGVVKVYARKVAYLAQDCDDTLHKLGTVERPQQQLSEDTAAGAASGDAAPGASHAAAEKRNKRSRAKVIAAAAPDPLGFGDGEWPDSDEEIFGTPSAAANAAMTATPGTNQPLLLSSLSMRPGESVLGLRTPAANRRLLADAETPLAAAARSLSMAASLPRPIDLEEMFEPVPEHFEFDLEEFEVDALAAPGLPTFESQQMSNLNSQPLLIPVPEGPDEGGQQVTAPVEDAGPTKSGGASVHTAHTPAAASGAPLKGGMHDEDEFQFEGGTGVEDFETVLGSQDRQDTVQYDDGEALPDGEPGADQDTQQQELSRPSGSAEGKGKEEGGACGQERGTAEGTEKLGDRRLTRAARAAAAAAAAGGTPEPAAGAAGSNKRSAATAELPSQQAAATKGARREAAGAKTSRGKSPEAQAAQRRHDKPSAQQQQQRQHQKRGGMKLAFSRAKALIDAAGTTMSNSEYRLYLMDRSSLLRPVAAARARAQYGAYAAPGREPLRQLSSRAKRPHNASTGVSTAVAAGPDLRLLFGLPPWAHAAVQGLYAQALGFSKAGVPVDLAAVLQRNQATISGGLLGGLMPELNMSEDEKDDDEQAAAAAGKRQKQGRRRKSKDEAQAQDEDELEGSREEAEEEEAGSAATAAEKGRDGMDGTMLDQATNGEAPVAPLDLDNAAELEGLVEVEQTGEEGEEQEVDPYHGEVVNVFEESRRVPEGEEDEEGDGQAAARGGVARDAALTARTRALLRQVEQLVKRQQLAAPAAKRARAAGASGDEPAAVGSVPNDSQGESVLLSQLLPEDRSGKRRSATAAAAAPLLRQRAAQTFYDLLVLQNRGLVQLQQGRPYQDMVVSPVPRVA